VFALGALLISSALVMIWLVLGGIAAFMCFWAAKPFLSQRISLTMAIVIGVCVAYVPFWRVFPGIPLAKLACSREGGLQGGGPVTTPGYLRTSSAEGFEMSGVVDALLVRKFSFVEEERKTRVDHRRNTISYVSDLHNPIKTLATKTGERYYRFYLAALGDPACEGYEKWMAAGHSNRVWLREKGLPAEVCIAATLTDIPVSPYALDFDRPITGALTSVKWQRYRVLKLPEKQMVREYKTFSYYALGASPMGEGFIGFDTYCGYHKLKEFLDESFIASDSTDAGDWLGQGESSVVRQFRSKLSPRATIVERPVAENVRRGAVAKRLGIRPGTEDDLAGELVRENGLSISNDLNGRIDFRAELLDYPGDPWHKYQSIFLILHEPDRTRKILIRPEGLAPRTHEFQYAVVDQARITALLRSYERGSGHFWIVTFSLGGQFVAATEFEIQDNLWEEGGILPIKTMVSRDGRYFLTFVKIEEEYGKRVVRAEYDFEIE